MARGATGTARKELPPSREKEKEMRNKFRIIVLLSLVTAFYMVIPTQAVAEAALFSGEAVLVGPHR